MLSELAENPTWTTAVFVNLGNGKVLIEKDGKIHTLKNLMGVDHIIEMTGAEAAAYLADVQNTSKPALTLV